MPETEQLAAPAPGTTVPSGSLFSPGGPIGGGANAWTLTTAQFTIPAVGSTVAVTVLDTSWAVVGEFVWVAAAGGNPNTPMCLQITATTANSITLLNPAPTAMAVSGDVGNLLTLGSDGLVYLPGSAVDPSTDAGNLITTGSDGLLSLPSSQIISSDAGNIAIEGSDKKVYVPNPTPGGILRFVSATQLSFLPYRGGYIQINGLLYPIPTTGNGIAGLTNTNCYVNGVAGQNLAVSTLYRVYVFNNAGTLTADFSTTAHSTSSTAGNVGTEIKSGDDTRSFIGLAYTSGTSQFSDVLGNRSVRSWFNGGRVAFGAQASLSITATASTVYIATYAVCFANEPFIFSVSAYGTATASTNITIQACIDGSAGAQAAMTTTGTTGKYENGAATYGGYASETAHTFSFNALTSAANTYSGPGYIYGTVG